MLSRMMPLRAAAWMLTSAVVVSPAMAQWTQWGGPQRDFVSKSKGLAPRWPADGPRKLWSRDLGAGYSTILVEGDTLFTMYRKDKSDVVTALSAKDGKTLWEYAYEAPCPPDSEENTTQFGEGPNATPLLAGGRLYSLGWTGKFHCLDAQTGKVVWATDFATDLGAKIPHHGFSASPLLYRDMVICIVGGAGQAVVAFNATDGKVAWKAQDFAATYSSPIIANVGGQEQLIVLAGTDVVGLNPANGAQLWSHKHENQWQTNIPTPIWGDDGVLVVSSFGESGGRGLKLTRSGEQTTVEEVWATKKVAIGQTTAVRVGDAVFCSSGSRPAFLMAFNAKTGEIGWRQRGFGMANVLFADGRLIVLDESGKLVLVAADPKEYKELSAHQLFEDRAWTAPTLVGKTLFVRDRKQIVALDLG